jgi:hypothetical protein
LSVKVGAAVASTVPVGMLTSGAFRRLVRSAIRVSNACGSGARAVASLDERQMLQDFRHGPAVRVRSSLI